MLNLLPTIVGTFRGLPAPERPTSSFMRKKLRSSQAATEEFLRRVPEHHWTTMARSARLAFAQHVDHWLHTAALPVFESWRRNRGERVELPTPDELEGAVGGAVARALSEFVRAVERKVDMRENPRLAASLRARQDEIKDQVATHPLLRLAAARLRGSEPVGDAVVSTERARAAGLRAGLSPNVIAGTVLLQGALQFASKMRAREADATTWRQLTPDLPHPRGPDPISDDGAFGRWHLAGPNPVVIERVRERGAIPAAFGISDEAFEAALGGLGLPARQRAGVDLARAIREGRLYLADFELLADLPTQTGPVLDFFGHEVDRSSRRRWLPAPYALFYRSDRGLLPVAIQLGRDGAEYEVFTPNDDPTVWARVKVAYLCAYLNHHEMSTHLGSVHFLLLGFAVSAARQLHPDHPISALLRPFLEAVVWNDFFGLQVLTNPKGFVEQILPGRRDEASLEISRRYYRRFDASELCFPRELARRGVDDPASLPDYPFRDDGMALWTVLREFVADYLAVYYRDPARDMAEDDELQGWFSELRSRQGAHVAGLPEAFGFDELAELLTGIVFRSSCFHSAVNYPQYDYFGHPDRSPAALYADPREIRRRPLADFLPPAEPALTQITVLNVLAGMRNSVLTDCSLAWFPDSRVWPLVAKLRAELDRVEADIERANGERPAYDYLRPSLVATAANV